MIAIYISASFSKILFSKSLTANLFENLAIPTNVVFYIGIMEFSINCGITLSLLCVHRRVWYMQWSSLIAPVVT